MALHIGFWHPYRNIFALVDELGISPFTGWNKAAYYSAEGLAVISLLLFLCAHMHLCIDAMSYRMNGFFYIFSISFLVDLLLKMGLAGSFSVCSKCHIVLHGSIVSGFNCCPSGDKHLRIASFNCSDEINILLV